METNNLPIANNPELTSPNLEISKASIAPVKTFPWIKILTALVIVLVGGMIYLFIQNQKLLSEVPAATASPDSPAPSPESAASALASAVPTAGWQTYTNEEIGFRIQYPAGWRNQETPTGVGFGPAQIGEDLLLSVNFYNKSDYSLKQIADSMGKQFPDRQLTETTVLIKPDNIEAEKFVTISPSDPDWYNVALVFSSRTHYISVGNGAVKDENRPASKGIPQGFTFEQFYSTFEFIE